MKTALIPKISLSLLFVAALISATGGAVYYLFNLSFWPAAAVAAVSLIASVVFLPKFFAVKKTGLLAEPRPSAPYLLILPLVYVLSGVCLVLLARAGTTDAINSPWPRVSVLFWVALIGAALAAGAVCLRAKSQLAYFLAGAPVLAVILSVAALVYRNGYGFDPFVHRAAEKFILDHGAILPKTPYYAGSYALVVIISALSRLPLASVDLWLVPAAAALGGLALFSFMSGRLGRTSGLAVFAGLAVLPYSLFISTTPFGLACLYALAAACLAVFWEENNYIRLAVWIFAVASAVTHPMAGVPVLILAALFTVKNSASRAAIAIAGCLLVPFLFFIQGPKLIFAPKNILSLALPFALPVFRARSLGDLVYLAGLITALILVAFIAIGALKNKYHARIFGLAALSALASALVTAAMIDFSYLPSEEQAGYPARLVAIAFLLIIPPATLAFADLLEKIELGPLMKFSGAAFLVFLVSANAYLAYPRADAFSLSKGWSVSADDQDAVRAIAADANGAPYIVLASEPVSAAALDAFGFFKYFKTAQGDVFAYPVPLGGELYKYYLKMIYESTSAETMRQAMALAGVKRSYFVMDPYWTGFARISAAARASASAEIPSGGNDSVFVYTMR
jgi:hypothetical protein